MWECKDMGRSELQKVSNFPYTTSHTTFKPFMEELFESRERLRDIWTPNLLLASCSQTLLTIWFVEFKDIRKEWRSRHKKDVDPKKGETESSRTDSGPEAQLSGAASPPESTQTPTSATFSSRPQLPPLGYTNSSNGSASFSPSDPLYQGSPAQVYSTYPHSPYNSSSQVFQR